MTAWIAAHPFGIRFACFVGILLAMAAWEQLAPRRPWRVARTRRWTNHLLVSAVNSALALLPITAVGVALYAESQQWGWFNRYAVSPAVSIAVSVVMLDFIIYLQHRMFHAVPALWRVHRVHHADLDVDVTTGIRFHPIEIVISFAIKLAAIVLIGAPALAVGIFEVLLNATSMFSHGNVRMPEALDRRLRRLVVTPDMHRVHHSIVWKETNSNFGFNLSWWDRLFGTYRDQPQAGYGGMTLGLENIRDEARVATVGGILAMPFRSREK